jgi:hypothetical protein
MKDRYSITSFRNISKIKQRFSVFDLDRPAFESFFSLIGKSGFTFEKQCPDFTFIIFYVGDSERQACLGMANIQNAKKDTEG